MVNHLFEFVTSVARWVAALPAALLPARRWQSLPSLPISSAAPASAVMTLVAGVLAGAGGFLAYAHAASDALVGSTLEVAVRQSAHLDGPQITTATPVAGSMLSLPAFLFFTPLGWTSMYLALSGLARAVSHFVDDPMGDPILTGLDMLLTGTRRLTRQSVVRLAREHREGGEVPDALYTGAWAGLPQADFVVVASRRKPDWTAGTVVITSDKWYTLGQPFDLQMPGGLRTAYPLTEQRVVEVLRRGVHYELPAVRRGPPRPA